jgi:hypothetical protein
MDIYVARALSEPELRVADRAARLEVINYASGYTSDIEPVREVHDLHPHLPFRVASDSTDSRYPAYGSGSLPQVVASKWGMLDTLPRSYFAAWSGIASERRHLEVVIECLRADSYGSICPFADALQAALIGESDTSVLISGLERDERIILDKIRMLFEYFTARGSQ